MPLKTYETKADYDAEYELDTEYATGHPSTRPAIKAGYDRSVLLAEAELRASKFVELLNLRTNQKILILGCGFGWTVEALNNLGFNNVVGVDTSPYIHSELSNQYQGTSDILTDEGNFKPQVVITEHLVESYSDAELQTLLQKYASVTVIHLVMTTKHDPDRTDLNMKTLEQWKALFPDHQFIEEATWRLL